MALLDPLYDLPRVQKLVLGAVGLVVVAAVGYFLLLAPLRLERDTLLQRSEALKAEVAKARLDEASLRPFRIQAAALRKRLEAARERMPAEREIPALYRHITDLAAQSGMSVALFAPKPPEERDVYNEVPIALTAEGTYHQLGKLFEQIGQLPRIVATNDMRLIAIERPTGTLRAELGLATYVFRPEGAPPPALPGAKPAPAGRTAPGGKK